jgi:hypothetical protein
VWIVTLLQGLARTLQLLLPTTKKGPMKPISITAPKGQRFPLIDWNYQPTRLGGYRGQCAKTEAPSFRNISRQYFQNDARRDFIGEAAFFAAIVITAAAPLFSTASAIGELCRAIGWF